MNNEIPHLEHDRDRVALTVSDHARMLPSMSSSTGTAVGAAEGMNPPTVAMPVREQWLFSRVLDVAMIGVPLFTTLVAFALSGADLSGGLSRAYAGWGSQFVFGNTTHVVLTFLLLGARRDVLHAAPGQAKQVLVGGAVVWVGSFALYYAVDRYLPNMMDMLGAVLLTFATHHTVSQSKGIWALYAMQADSPPSELERRMQRHYVPVALLLVMVRWLFVPRAPGRLFPLIGAVPGLEAPLPFAAVFALVAVWLVFARVTIWAVAASACERGFAQPKTRFVAASAFAILLLIVAPVWGSVLVSSAHGIEYFLLSRRMLRPLPGERTSLREGLVVPAMVVVVTPLFLVGLANGPFVAHPSRAATLAMFAMNGLVLAHYFADAFIYRFRIPQVRKVALARLGYGSPSPPIADTSAR